MATLDSRYLESLKGIPGVVSYRVLEPSTSSRGGAPDATLELRTSAGAHRLVMRQFRSHLSREMAEHAVGTVNEGKRPVLILAPHVGAGLSEVFIAGGVNYLDAAGNCHIVAPRLHVHVEGRAATRAPDGSVGVRRPGYQVLFGYLARPELLDAPLRAVAEATGVSRQPASTMKHRLLEEGYLFESKAGTRWYPRRREDALSLWLFGYQTTVRVAMLRGVYRTQEQSPDALERKVAEILSVAVEPDFRWGGTAAGFRLTESYRGGRTVVHIKDEPDLLVRGLRALADPRGNLIVMSAFGQLNWEAHPTVVHPLLAYSEMLSEGGERAREAAQALHDQHLLPLWDGPAQGER